MERYPTRNGLAVPTQEIYLPASRLDLDAPESYNNHHLEFSAHTFGRFAILKTLRDLEGMQELLPRDIHNQGKPTLHTLYSPPITPTPRQAMDRISEGFDTLEQFKIWDKDLKKYLIIPFTSDIWRKCLNEYHKVKS